MRCSLLFFLLSLSSFVGAWQEKPPILDTDARFHPVVADHGMVASQEARASEAGLEILKQGGNAVDAAVAVGFALAVTLPKAGNLGGGGFMIVYLADQKKSVAINFREMAPAGAHRDMYLDDQGNVDKRLARAHHLSAGVPGTPLGLAHALEKYGTMSLEQVIEPAIRLAWGMSVTPALHFDLDYYQERLAKTPATKAIFLKEDGTPYHAGEKLVQKDLAWTLTQIAQGGVDAFYKGEVARRLVADMKQHGGLITMADMANYKVTEMAPVSCDYRGYKVVSMPPPSSGGVHVIQMLNILKGWPIGEYGWGSAQSLHLMTEAMRVAYADRSKYLGDPDFCKVPVAGLTSEAYARQLQQDIDPKKARKSTDVAPGTIPAAESPDTTHFSVMDGKGNAVALTYTLNFSFGSGIVAEGTGVLLNNEMDDFSAKPGSPNAYGLLGGEANSIQPGKRPLSSMTPTILFKDEKPFLVTGSPGGSRIITTVLQIIINVVDHDMNIATATATPRMHHQWFPDKILLEQGFSPDTIELLKARGHQVEPSRAMGSTQSIMFKNGRFHGASDPRRLGALTIGY